MSVSSKMVQVVAKMISPKKADLLDDAVFGLIKKHGFKRVLHEVKKRQRVNHISKLLRLVIDKEFSSRIIFQFLTVSDIAAVDTAFINHDIRFLWLSCQKFTSTEGITLFSNHEVKWCKTRNIFPATLCVEGPDDKTLDENDMDTNNSFIDDNGLISLCTKAKNIKYFKLQNSHTVTDIGFSSFIGNCSNLQTLDLNNCPHISDASLNVLGMYCGSNLKSINISNCPRFSNIGIENLLKSCKSLVSLTYSCDYNAALATYKMLIFLGKYCPLLEYLQLDYIVLSNIAIDTFANGCNRLKSLVLGNIIGVAVDDFLRTIGDNCKTLEVIDIGNIFPKGTHITNYGIRTVIEGCHLLKELVIRSPLPSISDNAFPMLSQQCPLLEVIHFTSCPENITDLTMEEIGKLPYLEELHIPNNQTITDDGIKMLLNGKESFIERLSLLIDGILITNDTLDLIAKKCKFLKDLTISCDTCHHIPSESIMNLLKSCPYLKSINGTQFNTSYDI